VDLMRAVAYCRFSPRRDEDWSESNEYQYKEIEKWCMRNGYTIDGKFQDKALSGDVEDRPGLWQAIYALKKGSTLVVHTVDRLARDVPLGMIIEAEIKKRGAKLVSVMEPSPEDNTGVSKAIHDAMRTMLYSMGAVQKAITKAKTSAAMQRHQANGRAMSFHAPYGWKRGPDKVIVVGGKTYRQRSIELCPEEQSNIDEMIKMYRKGFGYVRIARELDEMKIPCRTTESWESNKNTIKNALKRRGALSKREPGRRKERFV
jgi:site-specific DNA recombinase